jgi:hypothetical protein
LERPDHRAAAVLVEELARGARDRRDVLVEIGAVDRDVEGRAVGALADRGRGTVRRVAGDGGPFVGLADDAAERSDE